MTPKGSVQIQVSRACATLVGEILWSRALIYGKQGDWIYEFGRRLIKSSSRKRKKGEQVSTYVFREWAEATSKLLVLFYHPDFEIEIDSVLSDQESAAVIEMVTELARALAGRRSKRWTRKFAEQIIADPSNDPAVRSRLRKRLKFEDKILGQSLSPLPISMRLLLRKPETPSIKP